MTRSTKGVLVGFGILVVAIAVVGTTVAAAGFRLFSQSPSAGTQAVAASPSPATKQAKTNTSAKAIRQAVTRAEGQVLGMTATDLTAKMKQGTTVHQMADQKGIAQADFQARFNQDLKVILDQDVQQGMLTSQQEQKALKRMSSSIPNWDQAGKQK